MAIDRIPQIEEAALNAWPAPRQMVYDGWLLRFTGGPSKRVNSTNVLYPSRLPLPEKIKYCEAVYAQAELPPLFRFLRHSAHRSWSNLCRRQDTTPLMKPMS